VQEDPMDEATEVARGAGQQDTSSSWHASSQGVRGPAVAFGHGAPHDTCPCRGAR
jgi:hypothetical protein